MGIRREHRYRKYKTEQLYKITGLDLGTNLDHFMKVWLLVNVQL